MDSEDVGCMANLPGAYTCLVVRPGGICAITDVAGQFPVYYSRLHGETLVGLHPGVLAARHGRAPDPVTAAALVACSSVLPLWASRSPYDGIHRAGGGAVLHVRAGTLRIDTDPPVPVRGTTRAEGAAALRAALVQAVSDRCASGPVSSDFSGGLDSTSLAFLAARYSSDPVRAVVYHNPLAPAADLADAARCARLDSNITLTVVRGTEQTLPYQAITDAAPGGAGAAFTSEPAPQALAWRRSALRLAEAADWGTHLHLTGEGGDAVLGAAPAYLADLARDRSLARLLRHSTAHARLRHTSPALLARRAVRAAATRPAAALRDLAAALQRPATGTLSWPDAVTWWPVGGEAVGWLTGRARQGLAEIAADPRTAAALPPGAGPADVMALTELRHSANAQRYLRELGHRAGVAVHAPFLDNSVVRCCLRVPASQRADPWVSKPLITSALVGLVPDPVLGRRSKGDYTAEEYRGARAAAPRLRHLLHESRLAALGVIEPARVHESLDRLFVGTAVPLGGLNQLLATELWLRDLEGEVPW
jgi:asparagine synthase (glutamine-hydrolysing)